MEFGSGMLDVARVEEKQDSHMFEDVERRIDQLKSLLIHTLFDWFRACGFSDCTSIFEFQHSFRSSN